MPKMPSPSSAASSSAFHVSLRHSCCISFVDEAVIDFSRRARALRLRFYDASALIFSLLMMRADAIFLRRKRGLRAISFLLF